ncbi:helix-turn-helix transcriptional regulator [Bacillus thuringiensis]|uniref:helix-turn-helix transcriptional regulator n=1 Tax=Bacillus thuringiensis TaxID=1428 RepID=UPI000ABD1EC8|nr:helix-turn-helix transcriptional regulator [Bacillus thuringiensis]MDR5041903.1 helix-turn-helix transcriptional regulator [Bacillus thuringiensis]
MNNKDREIEYHTSNALNLTNDLINSLNHDPKRKIAIAIKNAMHSHDLSVRKLADKIEDTSHPQIIRITNRSNYNIDTLIKVLNALNLEIEIKPKI